jgi:phytoene dehydrogenase-like protein
VRRLFGALFGALVVAQLLYGRIARLRTPAATKAIVALALGASSADALAARGGTRGSALVGSAAALGFAAELAGVATGRPFGHYAYSSLLGRKVGGVPLAAVVWSGDALVLDRLLGRPTQPEPERSLSGFALMLGLRGRSADLVHHAIEFPADYDAEFDDVFVARRLVRDPTLYVSASCASDPSQAPGGAGNWLVLANAPSGVAFSEAELDEYEARLVARLGVGERIVVRGRRTPLERETGAVGGAIYGAAPHGRLGTLRRPGPVVRGVAGLYRAGGTAHPGGGLPLVALSGRVVADLVGPAS